MRQPGRRAELQRDPHGVARRRTSPRHPGDHRRHAVRVVAAGHQPGRGARRGGRRRRRHGVRCGGDEPNPHRRQLEQGVRPRHPDPPGLLRPLRDDVAVRGRRAHRRRLAGHPRRHRPLRAGVAGAGRPSVDGRSLRRPGGARRGARPRRGRHADRCDAPGRPRRGPARDVAGEAGDAEAGRSSRRRAHRRQLVADLRRRRSGAADDRGAGERARSHAAWRGSSTAVSSASTRC